MKTRHESVTYGALWQGSHRPQPAEREVLAKEIATNMGLKVSASRAVVAQGKAEHKAKRLRCAVADDLMPITNCLTAAKGISFCVALPSAARCES